MTDPQALLGEFARTGSEAAFGELVARYVNLVYSTALRLVGGDRHRAEDVAQTVFVRLARKARGLSGQSNLGGWLHRDTCFVARTLMRGERRRLVRERQAAEMTEMNRMPDPSREALAQLAPELDEAINELGEADRRAILLRFFEQRDLRSVGLALGGSEDAARMRVNRALGKLESLLKHRGVALSAAALGTLLAGEAVTAAPAGLATAIATGALAGATTGAGVTFIKLMSMTKTGILSALALAAVATPLTLQHRAAVQLREDNRVLQAQADQVPRLIAANQRLSNLVASANPALPEAQMHELLRLRGEVGLLRQQAGEAQKTLAENRQLQAALAQTRQGHAQQAERDATAQQQRATGIAKMNDAKLLVMGLVMFANDHQNQVPTSFAQMSAYLPTSGPTLTGTNQFELVYQGAMSAIPNPASTIVLREQQAWQAPNGSWNRTYGFADGHSEVHNAPDGNFGPWEQQHLMAPPASGAGP